MNETEKQRVLRPLDGVRGRLTVPGDKSLSHRSLMFGAVAEGVSRVRGLASGGDVRSTRAVLETIGVPIRDEGGAVVIEGRGWAGLDVDGEVEIDCGNSGTSARLLCGLLAGRRGRYRLIGDASLSRRPMARVTRPLAGFGADFDGGETLPITICGGQLTAANLDTGVASAQVKSALILAALQADGPSIVREARRSRDHTERLMSAMGAPIEPIDGDFDAALAWRIGGGASSLMPLDFDVPGDPSSAAYAVALACALPDSEIEVEHVCLNPGRIGFYRLLARMGADIDWQMTAASPEPVGAIRARGGPRRGIEVGPEDVVDAIDELPLLAVIAATAEGRTVIRGAEELRHKESDRIAATARLLTAFGARVEERPDGLVIEGDPGARPFRGAAVDAEHDHRIAMCAAVAAALSEGDSSLTGGQWVAISYPGFFGDLARLGGCA